MVEKYGTEDEDRYYRIDNDLHYWWSCVDISSGLYSVDKDS